MPVTVRVLSNKFGELSDAALEKLKDVPDATAHLISQMAESTGPVDTGAYISSQYVVSQRVNGYAQACADALAQNPDVQFAEEVPIPDSPYTAVAASAVAHGIFVEMGGGHTPAYGTLTNAAEQNNQAFQDMIAIAIQEAIDSL